MLGNSRKDGFGAPRIITAAVDTVAVTGLMVEKSINSLDLVKGSRGQGQPLGDPVVFLDRD